MHAFISVGCDQKRTVSVILRHNVNPIEYGRCLQIVARNDDEADKSSQGVKAVVGIKNIQCWTDGSGQAKKNLRPVNKRMLDAAFKAAVNELDRLDTRTDSAAERNRIGESLLACLTSEGNDWPDGAAKLMSECAS